MSIKDLFKKKNSKILSSTTLDKIGQEVESIDYVKEEIIDQERFIPDVDFSDPSNFVRFGSAEKYYTDSISRVYNQYPFDGSLYEKQQFYNSSSYLDKYIFDNLYPRTNGFARFSPGGWGTNLGFSVDNFGNPQTPEYIQIKGVMNVGSNRVGSNIYDEDENRAANLKLDGSSGNTIEFWLKKDDIVDASTQKEVIFDLWNGATVSHAAGSTYGRFLVYLDGTIVDPNPLFKVTYVSGTISACTDQTLGATDGTIDPGSLFTDTWNHFAISAKNSGTSLILKLYLNGALNDTRTIAAGAIEEVTGSLIANIGAVRTQVNVGDNAAEGYGKLSGSLDEFRFWKTARTDKDIYLNWFSQIGVEGAAGTNTDTSNTTLGIYYKFNEGITGTSSFDSKVLDYSGRVSNGVWTGYVTSSRATGSAMLESGFSEFKDPIIYSFHPDVSLLYNSKASSGSIYDVQNNSSFYHSFPDWILDEDQRDDNSGHLLKLTQIVSSYLDTLSLQIQELPRLREARYLSGSIKKPLPFANRLLESMGFDTTDIFSDIDMLAQFLKKDEQLVFENKLSDIKNNIYTNIYNNLSYIYKSKGTEKAFRNLIRCYGIDDELVKINFYGNNVTYDLKTNYRYTSNKKKYIDFNNIDRYEATVYQYVKSSDSKTNSYISGNLGDNAASGSAMTFESEVIFPKKFGIESELYFETPFLSASLFGIHSAKTSSNTETSWNSNDYDFQVFAVRDKIDSTKAYFKLTGSYGKKFPLLTSSLFNNVYDNQKWNISVRVKPSRYPFNTKVSGSWWDTYIVDFYGVNAISNQVLNSFHVTSSMTFNQGSLFMTSPKRLYAGSHRVNFTGSVIEKTDVEISSIRAWMDYLSDDELLYHAYDSTNYGVSRPYENSFIMNDYLNNTFIPRIETLALHWDFAQVTSSDASGQFIVEDISSGSLEERNRYNWLGTATNYQHIGRGDFFPASEDQVVDVEYIYNAKQRLPEILDSSDMIEILERDDTTFTRDTRQIEFYTAIEKSMYQTISEEMINIFASIKDFNNLIGEPVNRYRLNYKDMNHLKSLFFEKIQNTPDIEKYVEFYKWIDMSLSNMIQQLIPLSANVSEEIKDVIESHILERNKYVSKFPTIEMKFDDPEGGAKAINELTYNWKFGSRPTSGLQKEHCLYWNKRALRSDLILSTSNVSTNESRNAILSASLSIMNREFTTPYKFGLEESKVIYSGINYPRNKNFNYINSTLAKALGLSTNQFSISASGIVGKVDCVDEDGLQKKYELGSKVQSVYEKPSSTSYSYNNGIIVLPFSIFSSSVVGSGYHRNIGYTFMTGADFVNLHGDTYGNDKETPMQSPFTEKWVGGLQYRHFNFVDPSLTSSYITGSEKSRVEGWRIIFDSSNKTAYVRGKELSFGALNLTPKGLYYRDGVAKRPLNIQNIKGANYNKEYEIVQTSGRKINNKALIASGGFAINTSGSSFVYGFDDYRKPDRGTYKHVFVERFSAPGGPEVAGDSNGGIGLDIDSAEYSVYNSMNYRNSIVREAMKTLFTRICGQYGVDSEVGNVYALTYQSSASFHKVNNNPISRMEYSGSSTSSFVTGTLYDNWYIQHPIPQDDAGYAWIQASSFVSGSSDT